MRDNKGKKAKILLISWAVHPAKRASTFIVSNLAAQFSKDELILAGQRPIDKYNEPWSEDYPEIRYVSTGLMWLPRGRRWFAWIQWLKFPLHMYRLNKIVEKFKPTLILAVFPDEYYLFSAYTLSKKWDLPLYPWFHNTYLENRKGTYRLFAKWLQPKVFKQSSKIFVMSDGLKDYYGKHYPDKTFVTLTHGFSIPPKKHMKQNANTDEITIAFTGTFNHTCYHATRNFYDAIKTNNKFKLRIYSKTPVSVWQKKGVWGNQVDYAGLLTLEELDKALSAVDFVLITHGFYGSLADVEYDTIFPTRTVPLLYSGKPLIAHCHEKSFLSKFLKLNNCALVINDTNPQTIVTEIERLKNDKEMQVQLISNAYKVACRFESKNVIEGFMKEIEVSRELKV